MRRILCLLFGHKFRPHVFYNGNPTLYRGTFCARCHKKQETRQHEW